MWYGFSQLLGAEQRVELTSTFDFDNAVFGIGHQNVFWKSDFYVQEYLYIPEEVSNANISKIMQWLNFR